MSAKDCQRAQRAYKQVASRIEHINADKYKTFALAFPALIHSCGLAQALAYAQAKSVQEYQQDLAFVVGYKNLEALATQSREAQLPEYRRLTYEVLNSASWIKRYVEAFFKNKDDEESEDG